jgi:hypothetical protein
MGIGVTVAVTTTRLVALTVAFKVKPVPLLIPLGWKPPVPVTSEGTKAGYVAVKFQAGAEPVPKGALEFAAAEAETPVATGIVTLNSSVMRTAVGRGSVGAVPLKRGKGLTISMTDGVATGLSSGAVEKIGVRNVALMAVVSDPTGRIDMRSAGGAEVVDETSELSTPVGPEDRAIGDDEVSTGAGVGVTVTVTVDVSSGFSLGPKRRSKKSFMMDHALR